MRGGRRAAASTVPPVPVRSPYDRAVLRLAVPALGALVAEPLYVLADTAVVGHLGTPQLGGLALASSVLLTGYALFIFLAYSTTASVARLHGARQEGAAARQGVQGLWLALLVGVVLVAVGLPAARPLVDALGTAAVRPYALTYLSVSLAGVPAMLLTYAGTGYLRGLQDTRTPLVVAVVTSAGNLALELLLIPGLGYGVGASAAATVVAQWAGAGAYLLRVVRDASSRGVPLAPDLREVRALAVVGVDLFVRTAALRGALLLATAVASRLGPVALAAHAVALEVWNTLALVLDALAIAGQALVGRLLGAADTAAARAVTRRLVEVGVVLGVLAGATVAALSPVLPRLFTGDDRVASTAATLLLVVAVSQPLNALVFVLDGVLIGAGDARYLAGSMVASALVYAPCAVAVALLDLGVTWLWAALLVLMLGRGVALAARARGSGWVRVGAV